MASDMFHLSQHEISYWIPYIDSSVTFDHGLKCTSDVANKGINSMANTETFNFAIYKCLKAASWFKYCLPSYLNIQTDKLNGSKVTP